MAVFRPPSFVPYEQRRGLIPADAAPDPFPALLKSWANRVKPIIYERFTRQTGRQFVPVDVQVVDNFIAFKTKPTQIVGQSRFRPIKTVAFQTEAVPTPIPILKVRPPHCPHPFVNVVRNKVLALGPEAYIPVFSPPKRHYAPACHVPVRRTTVDQVFVPTHGPTRFFPIRYQVAPRKTQAPIQPNVIPFKFARNRGFTEHHEHRSKVFPVAAPPPIVLQRQRQHQVQLPVRVPARHIVYDTPPTVLALSRPRPYGSPGAVRNVTRFVPAAVNEVPFVVHGRPRHVPVPSFGTFKKFVPVQGASTVVDSPIFVGARVRHREVTRLVRARAGIIEAPQSVLTIRSVRHLVAPATPRRQGFPFAVDRPVTVNVPFPIPRSLPRWVIVPYPKPLRTTVAAFPPPNVQQVVVTSRRIVR